MPLYIADYDPSWPSQAADAIAELAEAVPGLCRTAEHVGSTSVPGLAAKPIIDLMVSVTTLDDVTPERVAALTRLGYRFEDVGMPNRLFYFREHTAGARAGERSHHLHIVTADSWDTRNERLFRDHLRAHPEVAAEYEAVKRRLAAETDDGFLYTKAKTEIIQRGVDAERTRRGLPLVTVWEEA
ncbi:GrpB family protein [Streptomyces triticirhizae]|uniref:GrpB family protein n=1 Tax=Streptomyces triticirhizae TaxID=2483353 RepID=A0A3M2M8Z4_9ACTN|nr:GrpB family protein [Streptomyces triticirhizae]RMI46264.1 GrpB family protein [Streptomyces triticirhizae]